MKLSHKVEKKRQSHEYCKNYDWEYEVDYNDCRNRKLFFIDCDYNCDCDNEKGIFTNNDWEYKGEDFNSKTLFDCDHDYENGIFGGFLVKLENEFFTKWIERI